jgi:hypothetical protein
MGGMERQPCVLRPRQAGLEEVCELAPEVEVAQEVVLEAALVRWDGQVACLSRIDGPEALQ